MRFSFLPKNLGVLPFLRNGRSRSSAFLGCSVQSAVPAICIKSRRAGPILSSLIKRDDHDWSSATIMIDSDDHDVGHDKFFVHAVITKTIYHLKELLPELKYCHYITDSPTSQYRNKSIFHLISNHSVNFGMPATWTYSEAGHGKGQCDPIGGTSKRLSFEMSHAGPKDMFCHLDVGSGDGAVW